MKKANVLKTLVAVATIFVGFTFAQCGSSIDKQFKEAAEILDAACPMDMGGGMRLDEVKAESGKKLIYAATISSISVDDAEAQMFVAMLKPMMVQAIKSDNSRGIKIMKDLEATMVYIFHDRNGKLLTEVELLPKEYK
ncbi:MAG: hypothetical protein LBG19_02700 [Prevotellaceae bacterium]|jgi:hypothetical protein|nr:hypothetical protein [Prevotellaceae bacterium]